MNAPATYSLDAGRLAVLTRRAELSSEQKALLCGLHASLCVTRSGRDRAEAVEQVVDTLQSTGALDARTWTDALEVEARRDCARGRSIRVATVPTGKAKRKAWAEDWRKATLAIIDRSAEQRREVMGSGVPGFPTWTGPGGIRLRIEGPEVTSVNIDEINAQAKAAFERTAGRYDKGGPQGEWTLTARAFTREELENPPPPPASPLPWLPAGHTSLIYGEPKSGKSTLCLLQAVAIASGETLPQGIKPHGDPQCVLFLSVEETRNETAVKLRAIESAYPQVAGKYEANLYVVAREDFVFDALTLETLDAGAAELHRLADEIEPAAYFMDPLADVMEDESNAAFRRFVKSTDAIAETHGCAVVLVHHTRKASKDDVGAGVAKARGGSTLRGKVRSSLEVSKDADGVVEIWVQERNMGAADWRSRWEFEAFAVARGWPAVAALVPCGSDDVLSRYDENDLIRAVRALADEPVDARRDASNVGAKNWRYALAKHLSLAVGTPASRKTRLHEGVAWAEARAVGKALLAEGWLQRGLETDEHRHSRPVIQAGPKLT